MRTIVYKLNGVVDADGTIDLATGANNITIEVTNGDAEATYTVTVTRPPPWWQSVPHCRL